MVSFPPNVDVRILRKADKIWHIEVQGRRGWAPVTALQENKMIVRKEQLVEVFAEAEMVDESVSVVDATVNKQPAVEQKLAEAPAVEEKPAEAQPVEEKSADALPVEEKPAEVLPVEENPAEIQPAEEIKPVHEDVDEGDEPFDEPELSIGTVDIEAQQLSVDTSTPTQNVEELDEDDLLAMEDEQIPVDEPLFIKKDAYKVGEDSLDKSVKLEVVGIDSSATEHKAADAQEPDSTNVEELIEATITEEPIETSETLTTTEEISQSESNIDTEQTLQADSIPQENVVSVQNDDSSSNEASAVVESEIKEEVPETLLPSSTVESVPSVVSESTETVAPIPDIQPSFAAQQTVIDGTTIPDFDNESILSTVENENKPTETETLKTATVMPTINVQPDDSNTIETAKIEIEQFTSTLDIKPVESYETVTSETVYEYEYQAASTQSETYASAIDATVAVDTTSPGEVITEPHVQSPETNEASNEAIERDQFQAPSHEDVPFTSHEEEKQLEPTKPAIFQNLGKPVEIPTVVSEQVVNEPQEAPQESQAAPLKAEIHNEPVEIGVGKVEEVVRVEEQPPSADTDDIFSANYVPKTDAEPQTTTDEPINESNWWDGILIGLEDMVASIVSIFKSDSAESSEVQPVNPEVKEEVLDVDEGYCEKLDGNSCPKTAPKQSIHTTATSVEVNYTQFINGFLNKLIEMANLVMFLSIAGACILLFLLGQQCLANNGRESDLVSKLNIIERRLLTSDKECGLVKTDLLDTRKKLASIADKSFGTDDMIKQCESEKSELRVKIESLEKELEISVEAGLELNKMVTDLLNNQSGSDSIISSVEELQKQLNEQEATTVYINNLLGEKSRENSELQILLSESNNKFGAEIDKLLKENDELRADRETVEGELKDSIDLLQMQLNRDLEEKSIALEVKTREFVELNKKYEEVVSRWQISMARADAYEDSISKLKELNGKDDIRTVIEITNSNAKLLATEKENETLKEKLDADAYAQSRLNEQINLLHGDISRLQSEFNQNEKDKLEAQTRLEVLSSYFKDKEAQLQQ